MSLENNSKRAAKSFEVNHMQEEEPVIPKILDSSNTGPQKKISRNFFPPDKDKSQVLGQHSIIESNRRRHMHRPHKKN